jgi:hypothetical protein
MAPNELYWTADDTGSELEAKIKNLIDRVRAAREGSAEYEAAVRQLGELIDGDEDALLIAEEYQSLLATLEGPLTIKFRAAVACPRRHQAPIVPAPDAYEPTESD